MEQVTISRHLNSPVAPLRSGQVETRWLSVSSPEELIAQVASVLQAEGQDAQLLHYDWMPAKDGRSRRLCAVVGHPTASLTWIVADCGSRRLSVPSLAAEVPAALWLEREMCERSGVRHVNHPDLRPILQPQDEPLSGIATGAGVFALPLGPVRADVTESVFLLFDTIGEQIMHMQPQLFYKHRAVEALATGMAPVDAVLLAERISGTSTVAHATAYCRAVEAAASQPAAKAVEWERVVFGELERLYNHAHDAAQMASAAGMTVGQAQLSRVKEEVLRLCADLTGSRYMRSAVRLHEGTAVPWAALGEEVFRRIGEITERYQHFTRLLERTPTFVDRLRTTGRLLPAVGRDYGVVGPTARACGLRLDSRSDYLGWLYNPLDFELITAAGAAGDAQARWTVRVAEWDVSVRLLLHALAALDGSAITPVDRQAKGHDEATVTARALPVYFTGSEPADAQGLNIGIGIAESPRGRVAHVVQLGDDGQVAYWRTYAASAWNWPIVGLATANGNIQTDFPVIDASFGLSCAGVDR